MTIKKLKIIRSVTVDTSLGFIEPMIPFLKTKYELQLLCSPGKNIDRICQEYEIVYICFVGCLPLKISNLYSNLLGFFVRRNLIWYIL